MVIIEKFDDEYGTEDFDKLTHEVSFFDKKSVCLFQDRDYNVEVITKLCTKRSRRLNDDVINWLHKNIKDQLDGTKGWCVGNDEYNSRDLDFSIWFYRRKDALAFIRQWSVYKKPTGSYNQNSYIEKKLNLETMTMQRVER